MIGNIHTIILKDLVDAGSFLCYYFLRTSNEDLIKETLHGAAVGRTL